MVADKASKAGSIAGLNNRGLDNSIAKSINDTLVSRLQPHHIQVINDSGKHAAGINNPTAETHFTLVVVTNNFIGETLVARHRLVYKLLAEHLTQGVHALSLQLHTEAEWSDKNKDIVATPECANL